MTTMVGPEAVAIRDFGDSVGRALTQLWGDATAAPTGDLAALWDAAAAQGWFELAEADALGFLLAAQRELGRRACPLPVADAYVAGLLLEGVCAAEVMRGEIRPIVCFTAESTAGEFSALECAAGATHVLRVDAAAGMVDLLPIEACEPTPGLAVPAWSTVATAAPAVSHRPAAAVIASARRAAELALAVRALAAADRAHELAIAHARTRTQFGRPIGAFGAVQQRVAHTHIELSSASLLVDQVVLSEDPSSMALAADLAIHHCREVVTPALRAAQHTLGAVGYFEEHEAAWLFRRVHVDVAALDHLRGRESRVAHGLLEAGLDLPQVGAGGDDELRSEVRGLLRSWSATGAAGDDIALRDEYARRGLFALGWPAEFGGREATPQDHAALASESKYQRAPVAVDRALSATALLGSAILRHGTAAQQEEFLPVIRRGEMAFCLGYSEPEVGSDLASVRTRATRDGDGWVVDGQKAWTTRAQTATHVWLATRTNPEARPRHAGITIFLVRMDSPGIEVRQHTALSGEISCTVFYDNVLVPDSARVGEVDGGWEVITAALGSERLVMGGIVAALHRQLDDIVRLARDDPRQVFGSGDSRLRHRLASLASRLQSGRALAEKANLEAAGGSGAAETAPMSAVLAGDLAEDLGQFALEALGAGAALSAGSAGAVGGGVFEQGLRLAPMFVIGGGTNDIQRALIARRLGLARE